MRRATLVFGQLLAGTWLLLAGASTTRADEAKSAPPLPAALREAWERTGAQSVWLSRAHGPFYKLAFREGLGDGKIGTRHYPLTNGRPQRW